MRLNPKNKPGTLLIGVGHSLEIGDWILSNISTGYSIYSENLNASTGGIFDALYAG
jgi:hypothetical protein